MSLYYFGNARTSQQLAEMRALEASGTCLFCPANLGHDPDQPILLRTPQWTVVPNKFPYTGARTHLLLIPHAHVEDIADLSTEAQLDFWAVLAWVRAHYGLSFYSLAARNGDCTFTGGTIRHVHLHVLQGDVDDPDHEPIRTKLSSREVDPDEFHARFPEHRVAIEQRVGAGEEDPPEAGLGH